MKNIIKKLIIVIILSTCLYWLRNFILEQANMQSVTDLLNGVTLPVIVIFVVLLVAAFSFLAYKTPALSDSEYATKVEEYTFSKFTPEEMAQVNEMSNEVRAKFLEEMVKLQSPEAKLKMDAELSHYRFAQEPSNLRFPKLLVKLALIALVVFSGYTAYTKVWPEYQVWMENENARKSEVINDQILYIDGLPPIQLLSNNTFKKIQIDDYIEKNIKTQPAYLLKNATMINICSSEEFEIQKNGKELESYVDGFASSNLSITLKVNGRASIITHELSHVYDYINGVFWVSNSNEFQSLWQSHRGTFTFPGVDQDYCNKNSSEFFAESSNLYVNDPDYLRKNCEPLYNYFASIYQ